MKKIVLDKNQCKKIANVMKSFEFEHPEKNKEVANLEENLFYYFILVGICHQINWNFLSEALRKVQVQSPKKFTPSYLQNVSNEELYDWLSDYSKKWRLDKRFRRSELVRNMAKILVKKYKGKVKNLLKSAGDKLGGKKGLYSLLESFEAYGEDPLCKKSAVLIDILDRFNLWEFNDWENYIPPIDYHIVRIALRNGVLEVKDEMLLKKLKEGEPATKEEDIIIRSAVINALKEITKYSGKPTKDIQGFYWALGRDRCDSENPSCVTCNASNCSASVYMDIECDNCCPLSTACQALDDKDLLRLKEHNFETTFY